MTDPKPYIPCEEVLRCFGISVEEAEKMTPRELLDRICSHFAGSRTPLEDCCPEKELPRPGTFYWVLRDKGGEGYWVGWMNGAPVFVQKPEQARRWSVYDYAAGASHRLADDAIYLVPELVEDKS